MIKIIAGGKKNAPEYETLIGEYQKRCKKPFDFSFEFYEEEKLAKFLEKWDFNSRDFIILADERGKNLSSPEFSQLLEKNFNNSKDIIIIIGGAFGVSEEVREKADFVWSFSNLVFPHQLSRLLVAEQIYRAQEISRGGKYHHE
ncbi:23S rRNA (pseudouridine(1915)-N(3))-methyltransferase RlmH [Candidatus Saccharibacteria bacterium]|nr:23S rRNA (pseudouridine(1915)-N(3))-methyltransferase RlmH [Candidatus Saccharibacteria bacterium]